MGTVTGGHQALLVDLYELTMAAGYFENEVNYPSTFELFVRELPENRSYLIAAGLEQVVDYLETLRFQSDEIEFLRSHPTFAHVRKEFFDYLNHFRFSGDLWAMPEGTLVFPEEPILRVSAPLIEAQIVETYLLSMINFQTMIATKATRVVAAAGEQGVIEFGTRRAHGPEAGVLAARAAYIGGCVGTSNVYAGFRMGIPIYGTAAHSWTMTFESEEEAFEKYCRVFPDSAMLLIDTYDTVEGARKAARMGHRVKGARIDSGDLLKTSLEVRRILDDAGLIGVQILASGDLNEHKIRDLVQHGAPINVFGVGTELATSHDAPALGGVYKLVEQTVENSPRYRIKLSALKATFPGKKQVFRFTNARDQFERDVIAREGETAQGVPLLERVMTAGRRLAPLPTLDAARERAALNLSRLDERYRSFDNPAAYPVTKSPALEELFQKMKNNYPGEILKDTRTEDKLSRGSARASDSKGGPS
jgi:nicotinate phosphoribosyltransferase